MFERTKTLYKKYFSLDVPIDDRICFVMGISGIGANTYGVISTISLQRKESWKKSGFYEPD